MKLRRVPFSLSALSPSRCGRSAPVIEYASSLSWEAYGRAGTVVLLVIQLVYAVSTTM